MKGNSRVRVMQGNEAMAEGAFAAGARFYAGYPITPSSEIAEISSRRLPELGGIYIQIGSSYNGRNTLCINKCSAFRA